jgi:hypothetical protein
MDPKRCPLHPMGSRASPRRTSPHLLVGAVTRQEDNRDFNAAFLLSPDGEFVGAVQEKHLGPVRRICPVAVLAVVLRKRPQRSGVHRCGARSDTRLTRFLGPRVGVSICFEGFFPRLDSPVRPGRCPNSGQYHQRRVVPPYRRSGTTFRRECPTRRRKPSMGCARRQHRLFRVHFPPGRNSGHDNLMEPAVLLGTPYR